MKPDNFKDGDRVRHVNRDDLGTVKITGDGHVMVTFDKPTPRGSKSVGIYDHNWFVTYPNGLSLQQTPGSLRDFQADTARGASKSAGLGLSGKPQDAIDPLDPIASASALLKNETHRRKILDMTPIEAATELNGNQYRDEGSKVLWESMKLFGLVAVFGASDDLMEFRGAINDEIDAYGGGTAYLTKEGLLTNQCDEGNRCPYFDKLKDQAATIEAKWDDGGFSFRYETEIPHAKFIIKEDDDNYCEGIVFALTDVRT